MKVKDIAKAVSRIRWKEETKLGADYGLPSGPIVTGSVLVVESGVLGRGGWFHALLDREEGHGCSTTLGFFLLIRPRYRSFTSIAVISFFVHRNRQGSMAYICFHERGFESAAFVRYANGTNQCGTVRSPWRTPGGTSSNGKRDTNQKRE